MARIYASSGDEGGGGIIVPDQPQDSGGSGGAAAPDMSGYYAAMAQQQDAQRNAVAQAIMAQQQQQATMAQQPDPYAQYMAMFAPKGQPSGSVTDVGWMNALQPQQGGVTVGGQPGTPPSGGAPFTGGGSMAIPNADYWSRQGGGGGGGLNPAAVGMSPGDWATFSNAVGQDAANQWLNRRLGGGPGNSGAFGGAAPAPSTGISDAEMQQAVSNVNSNRGTPQAPSPQAPSPQSPQGLTGFEAYSRSQQDAPAFTPSYQQPTTFADRFSEYSPEAPLSMQSQVMSFPGFDATTTQGLMGLAQQAAQNAADDAEADAADQP